MKTIKTIELSLQITSLLMVGALFGWVGTSIYCKNQITELPEQTTHVFTDNMKDCQKRNGEYYLGIHADGSIRQEWCDINQEVDYKN